MRPGDLVVLATDGCFDNLFDDEIADVLDTALLRREPDAPDAAQLAEVLASAARDASLDQARRTPFAVGAAREGFDRAGGKVDDVTVVCIRVETFIKITTITPKAIATVQLFIKAIVISKVSKAIL